MGQSREAGREQDIQKLQTSLVESMAEPRPAQRGRYYWRDRVHRQRQRLLIKSLRESSLDLRHRPILRQAACHQCGDVIIGSKEGCRIKEEIVDGTDVGVVTTGEELCEVVCQERRVEVDDSLVPNELVGEQDDVLAYCVAWMPELEESGPALFEKDVDFLDLPDLPGFDGFKPFDVKMEP